MPFPSPQGTQASITAMLSALCAEGEAACLWTYARGAAHLHLPFEVRRLWDIPRDRSLRSGPSVQKVLLDLQLALRLGIDRDHGTLVAHHVEAAFAAWIARRPFVFFAHTDVAAELPSYGSPALAAPLRGIGTTLDRTLIRAATHVAAISPLLATRLEHLYARPVRYVPTPWPVLDPATDDQRREARHALGIPTNADVLLYAGNLDAYQGWQDVVEASAASRRTRPSIRLLVATQSDATTLRSLARQHGIEDRIAIAPLMTEQDRARCHAAADIAVIPRRIAGGLPIKLLDALSRGVPIVTTQRAIAGLSLDHAVTLVDDDAPHAIAHAVTALLSQAPRRQAQIAAGSAYLRRHHSASKFIAAFDALRSGEV